MSTLGITLSPGDLPARELRVSAGEDGAPLSATVTVLGDARARRLQRGITLSATWGAHSLSLPALRSLGNARYSRNGDTTLDLGEQAVTETTLGELVTPGMTVLALVAAVLGNVPHLLRANLNWLAPQTLTPDLFSTKDKTPRAALTELLAPLGYTVAFQGSTLVIDEPGNADVVYPAPFTTEDEEALVTTAPERLVITGAEVESVGSAPVFPSAGPRLKAQGQGSAALLSWTTREADIEYEMQRQNPGDETWTDLASIGALGTDAGREFLTEVLAPGTHLFRLRALRGIYRAAQHTEYSNTVRVTIGETGPQQVADLVWAAVPGQIEASWTAVDGYLYAVTLVGNGESYSTSTAGGSAVFLEPPHRSGAVDVLGLPAGSRWTLTVTPVEGSTQEELLPTELDITIPEGEDVSELQIFPGTTTAGARWKAGGDVRVVLAQGGTQLQALEVEDGHVYLSNLSPETTYTLLVTPLRAVTSNGASQDFTTSLAGPDDDEALAFELLDDASRTVRHSVTSADGNVTDTYTTYIKRGGVLVSEQVSVYGTRTFERSTDGAISHQTVSGLLSDTLSEYTPLSPLWPEVRVLTETVTDEYGLAATGTAQLSRLRRTTSWTHNRWRRDGLLESKRTVTGFYLCAPNGNLTAIGGEDVTETHTALGYGRWAHNRMTLVTAYIDDGVGGYTTANQTLPEFWEDDSAPEPITPKDGRALPLSLIQNAATPRALASRPSTLPGRGEGGLKPLAPGGTQKLKLSAVRSTGGFGPEESVELPWVTDPGVLNAAADRVARARGPRLRVTRRYFAPVPVVRGGAVRSFELAFTAPDGDEPPRCDTTVVTEFPLPAVWP